MKNKKAQEEMFGFVIIIVLIIIIAVIVLPFVIKPSKPIKQDSPMAYSFLSSVMQYKSECGTIKEVIIKCKTKESCYIDGEDQNSSDYLKQELNNIMETLKPELFSGDIKGFLFGVYEIGVDGTETEIIPAIGEEIESSGYYSAEYPFKITTYESGKAYLQLFY